MDRDRYPNIQLPAELKKVFKKAPSVRFARSHDDLEKFSCGAPENDRWEVRYPLPDGREVHEATVVRARNGISVNYTEPYMRRRDPECMVIADDRPSEKTRFADRFGEPFDSVRQETFDWLAGQELMVFAYETGRFGLGMDGLAVCPANAGFFAFGLGLLQGIVDPAEMNRLFKPALVIYVAPPFRHTHFQGRQVVVHNRVRLHEIFSYNLYPGPSAKKGVYGALINQGEREDWITAHCSVVEVVTPYDNILRLMHEGASGGGKSEMLQQPYRLPDGRLLLGKNLQTGEKRYLEIPRTCELNPVSDDMALCHPDVQKEGGKLWVLDAEEAWFIRVDQITKYGTEPDLEALTVAPSRPLEFFNIDAVPGGTALIWEHIEDSPGVCCPNPRVIVPRDIIAGSVKREVPVDVRSFGVRTPPCSKETPSYGIIGIFHLLPPALAWLWRLVSPRGYANPSIVDTAGMSSEGVGSYWPFAPGRRVEQANILLRHFRDCYRTRYILTPNQHIGVWHTGFMPQWIARDYLARRGQSRFPEDQLVPARCPLLGYALSRIRIEGRNISRRFLQVETQEEVGLEAYDEGARILTKFFREQIRIFQQPDLDKLGRAIIECCLSDGTLADYEGLIRYEEE
jgi:hypothetical protein